MKKGFTLVEILIALLILGSGMVISFNLFVLGWQSLSYGRKLNEVAYFAQTKLEELKSQKDSLEMGETSAKEGSLTWKTFAKPLKFSEDLEIVYVELDIEFDFQAKPQKHRFISYFFKET